VLARELNLQQIKAIYDNTDATIEFFIHGALCVAYSGQCNISHAQTGRSANRGDCSQACRLPYTLKDDQGRVVAYEKHLLSMKDNDQTANLAALIDAGVRSFKIEGRYKDMSYVKNITAHYRQMLDAIIEDRGDRAPRPGAPNTSLFRQRIKPSIAAAPTILSMRAKAISARLTRRSLSVCRWGSAESR
jgi:putative protease